MMYPILCKVRYETLHHVFRTREVWIQIAFSIFVNWIVAPFFMVGFLFFVLVRLALIEEIADCSCGISCSWD